MDFKAPGGESLRNVQRRAIGFLSAQVEKWKDTSIKEKRQEKIETAHKGGLLHDSQALNAVLIRVNFFYCSCVQVKLFSLCFVTGVVSVRCCITTSVCTTV